MKAGVDADREIAKASMYPRTQPRYEMEVALHCGA